MSKNTKKKDQKDNSSKETKPKKTLMYIGIGIVVIILLYVGYSILSKDKYIPPKPAVLTNFEGNVEVFMNDTWQNAVKKEELYLNSKIRTNDGTATLVLFGKAFIDLDSDTEIEISSLVEDNMKITQTIGKTWNKFLGVIGANSYSVETPNAVATVRGTEFEVNLQESNETVLVEKGIVSFKKGDNEILLNKYEKGVLDKENMTLRKVPLTKEEIDNIITKRTTQINNVKDKRLELIKENTLLLKLAEKTYGLTLDDIVVKLDAIDSGEINDSEIIEKAPIKKDELRRIKQLNDQIKSINSDISTLEEMKQNVTMTQNITKANETLNISSIDSN